MGDIITAKLKVISSYFFKESGVSDEPRYLRYDATDEFGGGYTTIIDKNNKLTNYVDLVKIDGEGWIAVSEEEWIIAMVK